VIFCAARSPRELAHARLRTIQSFRSNPWFVQYREELAVDLLACSGYGYALQQRLAMAVQNVPLGSRSWGPSEPGKTFKNQLLLTKLLRSRAAESIV
jgi:hypothetical protein